jgi:hypothetical protein
MNFLEAVRRVGRRAAMGGSQLLRLHESNLTQRARVEFFRKID